VLECHYAIAGYARGAVLNINYRTAPSELASVLLDAAPRWLIVDADFLPIIEQVAAVPFEVRLRGKRCEHRPLPQRSSAHARSLVPELSAGGGVQGVLWVTHSTTRVSATTLPAAIQQASYHMVIAEDDAQATTTAGLPPMPPPLSGEAACEMYYTSGSTGRPKGVMLSHKTVRSERIHTVWWNHYTGVIRKEAS
jgi:acyl-CoA synthetase (AMP-forming)/AMP-acid ligase II